MGDGWLYAMEFRLSLRKFPSQAGLESGTASLAGWLVGCFGFNSPLIHYFSLYRTGRKRREKIEESQNVQTTPTRTYCKRNRPLQYYYPD